MKNNMKNFLQLCDKPSSKWVRPKSLD